jgi:hypothetical protein
MTPIVTVRLRDPFSTAAAANDGKANSTRFLVGTCVDWSPSGRVLSIGFTGGWLLNVHVETGDVIRIFYPNTDEEGGQDLWPPMLLNEAEGGTGIADGVKRSWSLSSTVLATRWQSGAEKPIPLEPTTCLALPMLRTSAPSVGELLRCDDVPLLFSIDNTFRVSVVLGGMREVYSVQVRDVPAYLLTSLKDWAPMNVSGGDQSRSASGAAPQGLMSASSSPVRSVQVVTTTTSQPLGSSLSSSEASAPMCSRVDAIFVIRTAPGTERLFSAALDVPQWCHFVANDRAFISAVLDEYTTLGLSSFTSCVRQWTACVHKIYHAISGSTTSASPHDSPIAAARMLRDMLIAPLASPSVDEADQLFSTFTTVSLFQALEQLHDGVTAVVRRLQCETILCLEAALDVAGKVLFMSPGHQRIRDFLGSTLLAARDVVMFTQREGRHLNLVLCWTLQQLLKKHATSQQQPSSSAAVSASHRWYQPPRSEDQPVIARTLHRMTCGAATASCGLDCSLDDLLALPRVYAALLASLPSNGGTRLVESATLFDLGARQVSHPSLSLDTTPRCSLLTLVGNGNTSSKLHAPVSTNSPVDDRQGDVDDGDLGNPVLIVGTSQSNPVDADVDAPAVRVFHIKDTAAACGAGSPPQVASYVVVNGAVTRLESGPAPIAMEALAPTYDPTNLGAPSTHKSRSELTLVAHAELSEKHVLLFSRGSQGGVTIGVFDQSGDCSTFESTAGNDGHENRSDEGDELEPKTTQCVLEIDGIMPPHPATSSGGVTDAPLLSSLLGLSVSSSRGFGVLHTIDRFMILEFDC